MLGSSRCDLALLGASVIVNAISDTGIEAMASEPLPVSIKKLQNSPDF